MVGGGLISAVGYYNPIIITTMVLFAVGAGMITTFDVDSPLKVWFGYQVLCGMFFALLYLPERGEATNIPIPGLGIGVGFQVGVLVVQTVLPMELVPVATACVQFFQTFGGAIMIAVAQTVFQNGLIDGVKANAPGVDPLILINSGASQVGEVLTKMGMEKYIPVVLDAYMDGLRGTFYITTGCACMAFLMALGLEWKSVKKEGKKGGAVAAAV
jgi:hypothetical protein